MGAYYKPHFFRISLPFKVEKELSNYDSRNLSRFIHEYIHFIQNLYTPWGLFVSFQSYSRIQRIIDDILKKEDEDISIPYYLEETDHDKWFGNIYIIGEGKRVSESKNNIDNVEFIPQSPIRFHRVKKYGNKAAIIMDIDTVPYGKQQVIFGAWIIKESMAQIIQTSIYPHDASPVKVIPYDCVSAICEQYAPSIYMDKSKILAICWASLFSMTPGESFLDLIYYAEQNPELSAKEIFENHIVNSQIRIKSSEEAISFDDFMNDIRRRFLAHLEVFVGMECAYFKKVLLSSPTMEVFSNLLKFLGNKDAINVDELTQELGMPVVFGDGNTLCFPVLENDKDSFAPAIKLFGMELVSGFVSSRSCICPLINMCENDEGIEKQYECISNPLMIGIDCPMNFATKIVGVHGRSINVSKD